MIQGDKLPRLNGLDLFLIQHLTINISYATTAYLYNLFGSEASLCTLVDMVRPGIYAWDKRKLVPENNEAVVQRLKNYL